MKFEPHLVQQVDMRKINLEVLKPWLKDRISNMMVDLLDLDDDIVIEFVLSQLRQREPDPRKLQISLSGFLTQELARIFMGELWSLLNYAQISPNGIPPELATDGDKDSERKEDNVENEVIVRKEDNVENEVIERKEDNVENEVIEKKEDNVESDVIERKNDKMDNGIINNVIKKENESYQIFLGSVSPDITEEDIKSHFECFGEVSDLVRPKSKMNNQPRGFCFLTFHDKEVAKKLVSQGRCSIKGHLITIKASTSKIKGSDSTTYNVDSTVYNGDSTTYNTNFKAGVSSAYNGYCGTTSSRSHNGYINNSYANYHSSTTSYSTSTIGYGDSTSGYGDSKIGYGDSTTSWKMRGRGWRRGRERGSWPY